MLTVPHLGWTICYDPAGVGNDKGQKFYKKIVLTANWCLKIFFPSFCLSAYCVLKDGHTLERVTLQSAYITFGLHTALASMCEVLVVGSECYL